MTEELKPLDPSKTRAFVNCIREQSADFFKKIIFPDQAYLEISIYVNIQNCRI